MQRKETTRTDFLSQLANNGKLTQDGKEWLTLALDPFHDYNHQIAGYPDTDSSQTVVSCYNYQQDIKAPAGVAGNWDAHIFNYPLCGADSYALVNVDAAYLKYNQFNPDVTTVLSTLNIFSNATGQTLTPVAPAHATLAVANLPASPVLELENGSSRVIGMGWEVTNTTAEVNKQGSVTVYKMPQSRGGSQIVASDFPGTYFALMTGMRMRAAPASVSEAESLKGTRTWDAAAGVYAVPTASTVSNPLCGPMSQQIIFDHEAGPTGAAVRVLASRYNGVVTGAVNTCSFATPNFCKPIPYDTTGAFFTGLSNSTTLTVKLRIYLEKAPTHSEPQLAVLASPSAGYDVAALELYAQACGMLPPAVRVGDNASGDWWRSIMRVMHHVAPAMGSAFSFVPGAQLAGKAVQMMTSGFGNSGRKSDRTSSALQAVNTAIRELPKRTAVVIKNQQQKPQQKKKGAQKNKQRK